MKIVFSVCFVFIGFIALNQTLLLSDPDYNQANPLNCNGIVPPPGSGTNFSDGAGSYAPNMNDVLVLCPDFLLLPWLAKFQEKFPFLVLRLLLLGNLVL